MRKVVPAIADWLWTRKEPSSKRAAEDPLRAEFEIVTADPPVSHPEKSPDSKPPFVRRSFGSGGVVPPTVNDNVSTMIGSPDTPSTQTDISAAVAGASATTWNS